jgi:hypothetical protein
MFDTNANGEVKFSSLMDLPYRSLKRTLRQLCDTHPAYPRALEAQDQSPVGVAEHAGKPSDDAENASPYRPTPLPLQSLSTSAHRRRRRPRCADAGDSWPLGSTLKRVRFCEEEVGSAKDGDENRLEASLSPTIACAEATPEPGAFAVRQRDGKKKSPILGAKVLGTQDGNVV